MIAAFQATGWDYWRSIWAADARVVWSFPEVAEPFQMVCPSCELVGAVGSKPFIEILVTHHNQSEAHGVAVVLLGPFGGVSL